MLAGVGGRSVAEAKERLTHEEALQWQAYRQMRGSLNVGMRLEAGFALVATMINRGLGGKANPSDFAPHFDEPESTLSDVLNILSGK